MKNLLLQEKINKLKQDLISNEILSLLSKDRSKCYQIKGEIEDVKDYIDYSLSTNFDAERKYWNANQAIERFNVIADLKYFNLNGSQKKNYSKKDSMINHLLIEFVKTFRTL
tara:strand:- start:2014 stop:2349 length:336 start_codon:yes stop_codon:yes gene_type:complete